MRCPITIKVNGYEYEAFVPAQRTLLDFLRDDLGLKGTKKGCDEGDCGACVVLVDGKPLNSCLILAVEADGRDVTTIEGLSDGENLHPLQQAFIDHGAVQCGYCTPGILLAAKALLDENPRASEAEVKDAISGHLCRCTGYLPIVRAILAVAQTGAAQKMANPAEVRRGG